MDINSINLITNAKEASVAHNNCLNKNEKDEFLILWEEFSFNEVSEAKDGEQLQVAFCNSPPDSPAEKLGVIRMVEFAKKKR